MNEEVNISPENGDVVVFRGRGNLISRLIRKVCHNYSHVGMVIDRDVVGRVGIAITNDLRFTPDSDLYIVESTTLDGLPDVITGRQYKGVKISRFNERIATYNGEIWIRQLQDDVYSIDPIKLANSVYAYHGRPYERRLIILVASVVDWVPIFGKRINKLIRGRHDASMFCTEVDAAIRQDVGQADYSDDPEEVNPGDYMRNIHGILRNINGINILWRPFEPAIKLK